jgi:hypothetical protein
VVVIVTDGAFGNYIDPHTQVQTLTSMNVTTFVVGVGVWLQPSGCRSLASNGGNYYGSRNDWLSLIETVPTSIRAGMSSVRRCVFFNDARLIALVLVNVRTWPSPKILHGVFTHVLFFCVRVSDELDERRRIN